MPISKWMNQKTMVHLINGIPCSRNNEGAPTLCDSMDGTGKHYAKWNKPGGERQIPYDLTFNRNLSIKPTNEQNLTKDTEIRDGLIVTRREKGGNFRGKGWRVWRNNYKGHMENNGGEGRWKQGREVWRAGVLGWVGGERQKTVLQQQSKILLNK